MKKILLILAALLMIGCAGTQDVKNPDCIEPGIYRAQMVRFAKNYPKDCSNKQVVAWSSYTTGAPVGKDPKELKCGYIFNLREVGPFPVNQYLSGHVQKGIISVTSVLYIKPYDCYVRYRGHAWKVRDLE